jgi:hypothetical protein
LQDVRLELYFIDSGRTDFGVRGEDVISEMGEELKTFLGESCSIISNFSLAILIKQSSVANIVSPEKTIEIVISIKFIIFGCNPLVIRGGALIINKV